MSTTRVVARANEGGHYVDPSTLASNFFGNLEKLDQYFPLFDSVTIIDTSGIEHIGLAVIKKDKCHSAVSTDELPIWFLDNLPRITRIIADSK